MQEPDVIDIAIQQKDVQTLRRVLAAQGYRELKLQIARPLFAATCPKTVTHNTATATMAAATTRTSMFIYAYRNATLILAEAVQCGPSFLRVQKSIMWEAGLQMTSEDEDVNEDDDDYVVNEDRITYPVFQDIPKEINDDWTHGVLIGGMATETSDLNVAEAYWWAAQTLIEPALRTR